MLLSVCSGFFVSTYMPSRASRGILCTAVDGNGIDIWYACVDHVDSPAYMASLYILVNMQTLWGKPE